MFVRGISAIVFGMGTEEVRQAYTIGHSDHKEDEFLDLLVKARIQLLVDVRSNPYSRWASFADRENLKGILKLAKIDCLYLGDVLGGHPSDPDCYDPQTGKVDYDAIRRKGTFKQGVSQVLELLESHRLCLVCAEEDPTHCHRNLLIADSLRKKGVRVLHIRGDGRIQTDEDLWKANLGIPENQGALPL